MNNHRLRRWFLTCPPAGGLEQLWQILLVMMLVIDVVADLVLIAANGGNEVPACPEHSRGELLGFLLQPLRCFALQYLNDVGC